MAANKLRLTSLGLLQRYNICNVYTALQKSFYCTKKSEHGETTETKTAEFTDQRTENEESVTVKKSGFAKFDVKQKQILEFPSTSGKTLKTSQEENEPFAVLLRKSQFIEMGDPEGKVVIGEIYHVVGRDLYIDFGWKFPTVCTAPERNESQYIPGAKVKLLVKDLELATRFLGAEMDVTLLEAHCVLLGLENPVENTIKK